MGFLSRYKGVIIGVIVIVLVAIGFVILKKPADTETSGLDMNVVNTNPAAGNAGLAGAKDPSSALVLQLLAIQNIVFDTKFFEDPVYRELVDQSRPLEEREVGRPNPFLRIGIDGGIVFETGGEDGFELTAGASGAAAEPSNATNPGTGNQNSRTANPVQRR